MKMITPYITKEQFDRVFSTKPVKEGDFTLDSDQAMDRAVYDYGYSNLARCYVDSVRRSHDLQALIDSLMMEYCPQEMSVEQIVNWSNNQRPASVEKTLMINKALGIKP